MNEIDYYKLILNNKIASNAAAYKKKILTTVCLGLYSVQEKLPKHLNKPETFGIKVKDKD